MVKRNSIFIITCEHGGNGIPSAYHSLFSDMRDVLDTHRGYDMGALLMAKDLSTAFNAPLVSATVSRLLVDLNRSIGHPHHFSETTRALPESVREEIITYHYAPYRSKVEQLVGDAISNGQRVTHISSHSFTPELNGKVRRADVGLLYDPTRSGEVTLCARWKTALSAQAPSLVVRRNYPYQGKGDGLTSHLRQRYAVDDYIGIELEINQAIVLAKGGAAQAQWATLRSVLIETLQQASEDVGANAADYAAAAQLKSDSKPDLTLKLSPERISDHAH